MSELPKGLDLSRPDKPRWLASQRLRRDGWKTSVALKHADGTYMTRGQAFDAAEAINRLIEDFDANIPIDGKAWSHLAPRSVRRPPEVVSALSIGGALDAYMGTYDPLARVWRNASDHFQTLAATTQKDTRGRLRRLIETFAGYPDGKPSEFPSVDIKAQAEKIYADRILAARALPLTELAAEDEPLREAYKALCKVVNPRTGQVATHQANAIMTYASAWLSWIVKEYRVNGKKVLTHNPAEGIKGSRPKGRVVVWEQPEIDAVLKTAKERGWVSIGLAVEWALELSWSQIDLLNMKFGQVKDGRVKGTRSKTDNMTHTSLTEAGVELLARTKDYWRAARGLADNIEPGPDELMLFVDPHPSARAGALLQWSSDYFRHRFLEVRLEAGVEHKTFQDLRDTSITWMKEAGLDDHEIQSRSQHSLAQIRNILDKHYGMTTLKISDAAAEKLSRSRQRV